MCQGKTNGERKFEREKERGRGREGKEEGDGEEQGEGEGEESKEIEREKRKERAAGAHHKLQWSLVAANSKIFKIVYCNRSSF